MDRLRVFKISKLFVYSPSTNELNERFVVEVARGDAWYAFATKNGYIVKETYTECLEELKKEVGI